MILNVGITPYFRHDKEEICLNEAILRLFVELDVNPIVLPLIPNEKMSVHYLGNLDGLVVSGSFHAIDARLYGQKNMADMPYGISPYKNGEVPLIQSAINDHHMPVLGLCGGHQAINVACGGTMIQNIASTVKNALKHNFAENPQWYPVHDVQLSGYARELLGEKIQTNSYHDDAVGVIGKNLVSSGCTSDGVCEILESVDMDKQYVLGTQFHPELMRGDIPRRIFADFVNALRKYRESK